MCNLFNASTRGMQAACWFVVTFHTLMCLSAAAAAAAAPIKIMPLGDSITLGCGDNSTACQAEGTPNICSAEQSPCPKCIGGYRVPLFSLLNSSATPVELVGSLINGPKDAPPAVTSHEGHGGWQAAGLIGIVSKYAAYRPDLILLHIGNNCEPAGIQI